MMDTTTLLFLCYAFIAYFSIRFGYWSAKTIEEHWHLFTFPERIIAIAGTILIPLGLITASLSFLLAFTHN